MFGSTSRKELKQEREDEAFERFFRVYSGVACKIKLPEYETTSHGMITKGAATVALGLVGFAMTTGSKQKQKEIETSMAITDKGVKLDRATESGSDLKMPWNEIVKVNAHDTYSQYGLEFVFNDNSTLLTSFWGTRQFATINVLKRVAKYINSRATGKLDDDWNTPASFIPSANHFCTNCGSPLEDGANFCSECGNKII